MHRGTLLQGPGTIRPLNRLEPGEKPPRPRQDPTVEPKRLPPRWARGRRRHRRWGRCSPNLQAHHPRRLQPYGLNPRGPHRSPAQPTARRRKRQWLAGHPSRRARLRPLQTGLGPPAAPIQRRVRAHRPPTLRLVVAHGPGRWQNSPLRPPHRAWTMPAQERCPARWAAGRFPREVQSRCRRVGPWQAKFRHPDATRADRGTAFAGHGRFHQQEP